MELFDVVVNILVRTVVAGTPLLLGTLGEIVSERAGILNLGVEGMMAIGAVTGFIVTFTTGNPWLGMLVAVFAGAAFSGIHAFATISLRANQVVSGLAITMVGLGVSGLWGKQYIGRPLPVKMAVAPIPVLSEIPILGPVLFDHDPYIYISIALGIVVWFVMRHTRAGITLRSIGENPRAAESQGINVNAVKYLAVMIGGAFAGLAGAHLSTAYSRSWIEGMTSGRGWIVIALTIFALWEPSRAFLGAYVFGGLFVLQYVLQPLGISPNLLAMLPYLTTIMILLAHGLRRSGQRKMAAPRTLGEAFIRGSR